MRHDTSCKRPDFKNSSAERKSSTVKSSDRINLPVASRRESSSSTTESNRADDNSAPIRETITMRDDEPIVLSYKRLDAGEEELYEGLASKRLGPQGLADRWGHCDGFWHLVDALHRNAGLSLACVGELLLADRSAVAFGGYLRIGFRAVCSEPARTGHDSGVSRQRDYGQRYCSHALHRHGGHAFGCGIPISSSSCDPVDCVCDRVFFCRPDTRI